MFKTDKKSLEKLSFALNERDITHLMKILGILDEENIGRNLIKIERILQEVGRLKLEGRFYAFHVCDAFAEIRGEGGYSEGVEIWRRQGNLLRDYISFESRDRVMNVEEVCAELKKRQKGKEVTIYTGPIPQYGFLGLEYNRGGEEFVLETTAMDKLEIEHFKSSGIEVVVLDALI